YSSERYLPVFIGETIIGCIIGHLTKLYPVMRGGFLLTFEYGLDAKQELARVKGLGEIIIGTGLEALDAVFYIAHGREHKDGEILVLCGSRTHRGKKLKTSLVRHHHIHNGQVKDKELQQLSGFIRMFGHRHKITLLAQKLLEQLTQACIIIH